MADWLDIGEKEDSPEKIAYIEANDIPEKHYVSNANITAIVSAINWLRDNSALLDDLVNKLQLGGDLGGTPEAPIVQKMSAVAQPEKTMVPTVLPDGTIEGEDAFEAWVYDDTLTGYTLSELQTEYPTSAGRLQGFEVRCRLMTPPTSYRKESGNDSQWIKLTWENVT